MFDESSPYYDLIYDKKDYALEARRIMAFLPAQSATLLDVACGTGEHHRYLTDRLRVVGVDINPLFLKTAGAKNPTAEYVQADMRDFSTGRTYDAVTCLFGSIGYCQDLASLALAIGCLREHVAPGGTILLEPWITPEDWQPGRIFSERRKTSCGEICRMSHSRQEGRLSIMDFHYLVGEPGKGVRTFQEQHRMGLFSRDEMGDTLRSHGLTVEFDDVGLMGRGLYIARPLAAV